MRASQELNGSPGRVIHRRGEVIREKVFILLRVPETKAFCFFCR